MVNSKNSKKQFSLPLIDSQNHPHGDGNLAYLSDSSDEAGPLLRIGKVPLEWYKNYEHLGYDVSGQRVIRKEKHEPFEIKINSENKKELVIYDEYNERSVTLSKDEMQIIRNIRHRRFPNSSLDPFPDYNFAHDEKIKFSLHSDEPKSSYLPSKHEAKRIIYLVNAIKNGWIITEAERKRRLREKSTPKPYLIWDQPEEKRNPYLEGRFVFKRFRPYEAMPKEPLPRTEESYNPPEEYLLKENAKSLLKQHDNSEYDDLEFQPKKIKAMRLIPSYAKAVEERYRRALYLFNVAKKEPQKKQRKEKETFEDTLQKVNKDDFSPFPRKLGMRFNGHTDVVTSISVSFSGEWLASGSKDNSVKVWEIETGRCVKTLPFSAGKVEKVLFGPKENCLAVIVNKDGEKSKVFVFGADVLQVGREQGRNKDISGSIWSNDENTKNKKNLKADDEKKKAKELKAIGLKISKKTEEQKITIKTTCKVKSVAWHPKGKHLALVFDKKPFVLVLKMAALTTQLPFRKTKPPASLMFGSKLDLLFLAFKNRVVVYDVRSQRKYKTLKGSTSPISATTISPSDEHVLAGCADGSLRFFDFEMSQKPFKKFAFHRKGIQALDFHRRRPFFASASADGRLNLFHVDFSADLFCDPVITPVNSISTSENREGSKKAPSDAVCEDEAAKVFGGTGGRLLDCRFHPFQPWIFCCGSGDNCVQLFID